MSMQALLIRATFMAMLVIGLSLALIHSHANKHPVEVPHAYSHPIARTGVVQAKSVAADLIMLPAIHVRASIDQRAGAENARDAVSRSSRVVDNESRGLYETLTPSLPKLRLDMPYYSFGRAMPRASKE